MAIDKEHLTEICQPGTEACCRYLSLGSKGWECLKLNNELRFLIDQRVRNGLMRATGDNCLGLLKDGSFFGEEN